MVSCGPSGRCIKRCQVKTNIDQVTVARYLCSKVTPSLVCRGAGCTANGLCEACSELFQLSALCLDVELLQCSPLTVRLHLNVQMRSCKPKGFVLNIHQNALCVAFYTSTAGRHCCKVKSLCRCTVCTMSSLGDLPSLCSLAASRPHTLVQAIKRPIVPYSVLLRFCLRGCTI